MISLLKKILKVKDSTLKTYERNIKRLARIAGHDTVPTNKGWIAAEKGKALIGKINKMPLNIKRHLFVAGAVAFRAYTGDKDRSAPWSIAMNESANKYSDQRNKQEKTSVERTNWPKDGYKSIGKAASIMKRKISGLLSKKEYTNLEAYEVQKYIVLFLFAHHTFRLSPATLHLKKNETGNTLLRPRGSRKWVVTLREHKTDKSLGTLKVELSAAVSKVLSKYIPKLKNTHDYFLSLKNGDRMSKSSLSKLILRLTKSILNKKVGVRLARVLKVTSKLKSIQKSDALLRELGHSAAMQKTYVRKD
jgi:hypothetical protein